MLYSKGEKSKNYVIYLAFYSFNRTFATKSRSVDQPWF